MSARLSPTATVLGAGSGSNSGRVVISGGYTTAFVPLSSVELFTPGGTSASYTTTLIASGRADHTATMVGKWLVFVGGNTGSGGAATVASSADALDTTLSTNTAVMVTSTPVTNASRRSAHAAQALSNGTDILLMGGVDNTGALLKTAQRYALNPASGVVTAATANVAMANVRASFPALGTRMTDKIVVFGGSVALSSNDTGGTSIELLDVTGANVAVSGYGGAAALSVARHDARAVQLALAGASNLSFLVVGGDPGGAATSGSVEVIVDP